MLTHADLGTGINHRAIVNSYIQQHGINAVIDIGGAADRWVNSDNIKYANIDIQILQTSIDQLQFKGNISTIRGWNDVLEYVKHNGKFDFSICSHTLEDISSPQLVCEMLNEISNGGYISFPSKYTELSRNIESSYRGYIHHRWIFDVRDVSIYAIPKLPLVEFKYAQLFDSISQKYTPDIYEWGILWTTDIPLTMINDDFMGPNIGALEAYYQTLG